MTATDEEAFDEETVPRSAKWLVGILFVLLLVPGIIGFEAWPMSGWRLFSASRDEAQTKWVVQAIDAEGDVATVSLEELPLGYRNAEWPMAELPGASEQHRQDVCRALAGAVLDARPGTAEVRVAKDRQRLVKEDGEWIVTHDPEPLTTCEPVR